jgi:hypothetical protein
MKKLRLLLFEECNRKCRGCCNKSWDLANLPICEDYRQYDQILLTGGEPLLYPEIVMEAVYDIREQTNAPIYLYTAKTDNLDVFGRVLNIVNGITVTLHTTSRDIVPFALLNAGLRLTNKARDKNMRLNVFHNVLSPKNALPIWKVKKNIKWIKNCPLPEGEVFMKYKGR